MKAAIAEAEKIESANYTEESFAELTAALTAAKELPENSEKTDIEAAQTALETAVSGLAEKTDDSSSEPTPDSESEPDSTPDSSLKTDSKTDNSSSKADDSNSSTTSKTDSASSNSNANTTSNANSGANGSSNPNTGAASATAAGIILLSAIDVIVSRKK